jgi:hypothetical protein
LIAQANGGRIAYTARRRQRMSTAYEGSEESQERDRGGDFPNQSERDRCEIRVTAAGGLWCELLRGCDGKCHLFSLPQNKPNDRPRDEGVFTERDPFEPDPARYYYCRCVPDVQP